MLSSYYTVCYSSVFHWVSFQHHLYSSMLFRSRFINSGAYLWSHSLKLSYVVNWTFSFSSWLKSANGSLIWKIFAGLSFHCVLIIFLFILYLNYNSNSLNLINKINLNCLNTLLVFFYLQRQRRQRREGQWISFCV